MIATDSGVRTWTIPRMPAGDSAAARRMAADLRCLADSVSSAQRRADAALDELRSSWRGAGSCTTRRPEHGLTNDARVIRGALLDAADGLDRYAQQYDRAHEQHGWSWGRIAAVATVVAITATVVTVTVATGGTAAPAAAAAEAAVVGVEAEAMAGAAAGAAAAAAEAAEALGLATRSLSALQGIGRVALPRLYVAAVEAPSWLATPMGGAAAGSAAAVGFDLADGGRVHPLDILLGSALGYGEGVVAYRQQPRPTSVAPSTPEPAVPRIPTWGNPRSLARHAADHGADFGLVSPAEYEQAAREWFVRAVHSGAEVRIDPSGSIRVYERSTNTIGSFRPDGSTRTFFRPDIAVHEFPDNWSYWLSQPGQDVP